MADDDAAPNHDAPLAPASAPDPAIPPPPPPDGDVAGLAVTPFPPHGPVVYPARTPRAGELAPRWALATVVLWMLVVLAMAAIWKTSDQLGLSTWWIGPRGEQRPRLVQLLPFVVPVGIVLGALNHVRRLPWVGVLAGAVIAVLGVIDLGRVVRLGLLEIAIGGLAGLVSLASLSGTYRPVAG